jgi:hypothetical protein
VPSGRAPTCFTICMFVHESALGWVRYVCLGFTICLFITGSPDLDGQGTQNGSLTLRNERPDYGPDMTLQPDLERVRHFRHFRL